MIATDLTIMTIPALQGLRLQVLRSFGIGNEIRRQSGLEPESSNDLSQYAQTIQDEINSRQVINEPK